MSAPPYMKLYVGDYLGDTHHLGALEHGAYLLLLMAMWRAGGSLPAIDANLAKMARCTPDEWKAIRGDVLPFFTRSRNRLTHKRLAQELAKYENISGKRSEAGKLGGRPKRNENNASLEAIAIAEESNCRHNQNQNHIEKDIVPEGTLAPKVRRSYSPEFEASWKAYPHHAGRSSKPDAWNEWKRLPAEEQVALLGCVQRFYPEVDRVCGGKGAPCMGRWLKHGKHMNWMQDPLQLPLEAAPVDPWAKRIAYYTGPNRYWNTYDWGPAPGQPGCTLPAEVQRAGGFEPAPPLLAARGVA